MFHKCVHYENMVILQICNTCKTLVRHKLVTSAKVYLLGECEAHSFKVFKQTSAVFVMKQWTSFKVIYIYDVLPYLEGLSS